MATNIYRLSVMEGLSHQKVAEELGISTSGFVGNYLTNIRAITGQSFPESPSLAKQTRTRIDSLIRNNRDALSDEALKALEERRNRVSAFIAEEESEGKIEPEFAETKENDMSSLDGVPGIYAFSYGWYLENPEHRDFGSDATMFKVGKAENIKSRMQQHMRDARTVIPEPVVLVRAYRIDKEKYKGMEEVPTLYEIEQKFHRLLSTSGHVNRRMRKVGRKNETGTEWFLTNIDFLDAIKDALGLKTIWTGDSDYGDRQYVQ